MENRGSFNNPPNYNHFESSLEFEYTKDSRGLEFTLRDPSFRVSDETYQDIFPQQPSFNPQATNNFPKPLDVIPEQYPFPIPFSNSSSKKERGYLSSSNRKAPTTESRNSNRNSHSIKKWEDPTNKSGRGDVSADRIENIPSRRSIHSRSPSEKLYSSNDSKSAVKPKRENFSAGNAKDLALKNFNSNPSTAPGSDRNSINTLRREIEDLKLKLRYKENEVHEAHKMVEELHVHRTDGNFDLKLFKGLKEKAKELERENEELKNSLRNEILSSERQRSQLEIAKDALTDKLYSLHVMTGNLKQGETTDLLFEYDHLIKKIGKYEQEFYSLTEKQNILQANLDSLEQKNKELSQTHQDQLDENRKLKEDLQSGIRALQSSREEQKRLEEEKSNLLDYIDKKMVQDEEKLEELTQKVSDLEKQNQEYSSKIAQLTSENNELKQSAKSKDDILKTLMQENQRLNHDNTNLQEEIQQIGEEKNSTSFYKDEIERLKRLKYNLEEQNDEMKNELNSTRLKLDASEMQKGVAEYARNQVIEEEKIQFYENKLHEVFKENSSLILNIQNMEVEIKKLSYQKEDLISKTSRTQSRLEDVQQQLLDANINIERASETIKDMNADLEQRDKDNQELYNQNKEFKKEIESLQESNMQNLQQFEKLADEFEHKLKEIEMYKMENSNLIAELEDIKDAQRDMIKNISKKDKSLFEYENKMHNTTNSLKTVEKAIYNIEAENNILKHENDELKQRIESMSQETSRLEKELQDFKDLNLDSECNARNLAKDIEELSRENEKLIQENCELVDLCKSFRLSEKETSEILDEVNLTVRAFATDLQKNPSNQYFLNNCTANLKEHLGVVFANENREDSKRELKDIAKQVRNWFVLYFEEVRTDVLKLYTNADEMKQLRAQNLELSKKIEDSSVFVRNAEVDVVEFKEKYTITRNEKKDLQDRVIKLQANEHALEKTIIELREQNAKLCTMVDELKDINFQMKCGYEDLQKEVEESRNALDNSYFDRSDKESEFVLLMKENKQLRELLELIMRGIFQMELNHASQNLIDVNYDCFRLEKETLVIDNNLKKKEQEMKIRAQSGSLSILEISTLRKSIEQLKQEYGRSQAELGVFYKRKNLIEEDYFRCEIEERRKFEENLVYEKNHNKNQLEYEDMRLRYDDLVNINKNLQKRISELAANQYGFHEENYQVTKKKDAKYFSNKENRPMNSDESMRPTRSSANLNQYSTLESEHHERKKSSKIAFQPTDISAHIQKAAEEDQREIMHSLQMPKMKLKDKLLEARSVLYSMKSNKDGVEQF